uniref:Reprolysin n=1 Tax=Rhipicephalus zambeziensis TaxID=60191 RepID=A0A224YNB6_9ACAR
MELKFLTSVMCLCSLIAGYHAATLQKDGEIVYPMVFDGRDEGTRVLKINDRMTLNLKPTSILHEDFVVRTHREGVPEHIYYDVDALQEGLYEDERHFASVMLFEDDVSLKVEGVVGPNLKIKPLEEMGRTSEGHYAHLLEPIEEERSDVPTVLGERLQSDNVTSERSGNLYNVPFITPEVGVVVDSTFYANFSSYKKMVYYLMVEFTCINLRYRTVSRPRVQILFRSVVVTARENETYYVHRGGIIIDALKSLYNLVDFVEKHPQAYGLYDIVFFITGLDMAAIEGYTVQTALQGFAFVGSVCLRTRVGLGEDRSYSYIGIRIIAHELGHTLGCSHDGTSVDAHIKGVRADSARCPWEQGYLMSYIEENGNSMKFSSCCDYSISLVAWSKEITCLHKISTVRKINRKYNTTKLPGDILSLNRQCRMTYPTLHKTYFVKSMGIRRCMARCFVDGRQFRASSDTWPMIVIDGSHCRENPHMVCINGDCVDRQTRRRLQFGPE